MNNNDEYEYKYDKLYNITDIYHNQQLIKHYEYDIYNQLKKEENYDTNKTIEYTYDNSGNIVEVKENSITHTYEYGNSNWEDQLTKYDTESIIYDEIGNPIKIGENKTLEWIDGRILKSYKDTSKNIDVSYTYDVDGIRTRKIVNGVETKYYLENDDIIYEQRGNHVIYYLYDLTGIVGLEYNGNRYYYKKNLQEDIIGILGSNNQQIVTYEYDSWGKVLSIKDSNGNIIEDNNHIGVINPFRYRSYYYDNETGLYYLNSRYYHPEWKRFINADSILGSNEDIFAYNIYLYVSNNPINNCDDSGKFLKKLWNAIKSVFSGKKKTTKPKNKKKKSNKSTEKKNGSNINIPDYSQELNRLLIQNATTANYYSRTLNEIDSLSYFKSKVNHKAEWDFKREKRWEQATNVPYLGLHGKFMFNGEIITAEDFGNIHYGYVGKAMGFSDEMLYLGGGYAHCGKNIKVLIGPYYCDDPNDHEAIKKGIEMYQNQ